MPPAAASAFKPQAFAVYTELKQRLDELGLAAEPFEFVQPSLEDVFMDVVAREEAAAV